MILFDKESAILAGEGKQLMTEIAIIIAQLSREYSIASESIISPEEIQDIIFQLAQQAEKMLRENEKGLDFEELSTWFDKNIADKSQSSFINAPEAETLLKKAAERLKNKTEEKKKKKKKKKKSGKDKKDAK